MSKHYNKPAIAAWCPSTQFSQMIALGGTTVTLDNQSYETRSTLDIAMLNPYDNQDYEMKVVGTLSVKEKFSALGWLTKGLIPDGQPITTPQGVIAGGMSDGTLHLWNAKDIVDGGLTPTSPTVPLSSIRGVHHGAVSSVCFHPKFSSSMLTTATDGEVYAWDIKNLSEPRPIRPNGTRPGSTPTSSLPALTLGSFNPFLPSFVTTGNVNGDTVLYDIRQKKQILQFRPHDTLHSSSISSTPSRVTGVEWGNEVELAISYSSLSTIDLWDFRFPSKPIHTMTCPLYGSSKPHIASQQQQQPHGVTSIAWDTASGILLSADTSGFIHNWDMTGRTTGTYHSEKDYNDRKIGILDTQKDYLTTPVPTPAPEPSLASTLEVLTNDPVVAIHLSVGNPYYYVYNDASSVVVSPLPLPAHTIVDEPYIETCTTQDVQKKKILTQQAMQKQQAEIQASGQTPQTPLKPPKVTLDPQIRSQIGVTTGFGGLMISWGRENDYIIDSSLPDTLRDAIKTIPRSVWVSRLRQSSSFDPSAAPPALPDNNTIYNAINERRQSYQHVVDTNNADNTSKSIDITSIKAQIRIFDLLLLTLHSHDQASYVQQLLSWLGVNLPDEYFAYKQEQDNNNNNQSQQNDLQQQQQLQNDAAQFSDIMHHMDPTSLNPPTYPPISHDYTQQYDEYQHNDTSYGYDDPSQGIQNLSLDNNNNNNISTDQQQPQSPQSVLSSSPHSSLALPQHAEQQPSSSSTSLTRPDLDLAFLVCGGFLDVAVEYATTTPDNGTTTTTTTTTPMDPLLSLYLSYASDINNGIILPSESRLVMQIRNKLQDLYIDTSSPHYGLHLALMSLITGNPIQLINATTIHTWHLTLALLYSYSHLFTHTQYPQAPSSFVRLAYIRDLLTHMLTLPITNEYDKIEHSLSLTTLYILLGQHNSVISSWSSISSLNTTIQVPQLSSSLHIYGITHEQNITFEHSIMLAFSLLKTPLYEQAQVLNTDYTIIPIQSPIVLASLLQETIPYFLSSGLSLPDLLAFTTQATTLLNALIPINNVNVLTSGFATSQESQNIYMEQTQLDSIITELFSTSHRIAVITGQASRYDGSVVVTPIRPDPQSQQRYVELKQQRAAREQQEESRKQLIQQQIPPNIHPDSLPLEPTYTQAPPPAFGQQQSSQSYQPPVPQHPPSAPQQQQPQYQPAPVPTPAPAPVPAPYQPTPAPMPYQQPAPVPTPTPPMPYQQPQSTPVVSTPAPPPAYQPQPVRQTPLPPQGGGYPPQGHHLPVTGPSPIPSHHAPTPAPSPPTPGAATAAAAAYQPTETDIGMADLFTSLVDQLNEACTTHNMPEARQFPRITKSIGELAQSIKTNQGLNEQARAMLMDMAHAISATDFTTAADINIKLGSSNILPTQPSWILALKQLFIISKKFYA